MHTLNIFKRPNQTSSLSQLTVNNNNIRPRFLSLKLVLSSLLTVITVASTPVSAQQPDTKPTVVAGSQVNLSSITKAEWLQGTGPKSFEPGKVYIFECWATWCGPCIAMIPHVNELHKKYYDKGLRVYGLSVWENDKDNVKKFVSKKADVMSYPVAFTGNGSAFEKEWLKSAGVKSIPHAFIVRNGKLLASTQASRLTESLIETLLSGDEGAKKAADKILSAQNNQEKTDKLLQDSYTARSKKDTTKMKTLLKELKNLDPDHPAIPTLELWVLIITKQWQAALTALNQIPQSEPKDNFVSMTGMQIAKSNRYDFPPDFMTAFVKLYSDYILHSESPIGPNHFAGLSMLQWQLGDKQNAVTSANKCLEAAQAFSKGKKYNVTPYARFTKSVNEGTTPKHYELSQWHSEARKKTTDTKQ